MSRTRITLTPEQKLEAIRMYDEGATYAKIAEHFGCHKNTIGMLIRSSGHDHVHVGGVVTRTIPKEPEINTRINPATPQYDVACVVTQRMVVVDGLGTNIRYIVDSKATSIVFTNEKDSFEIQIDKIDDFVQELQAVARNAAKVKVGTEAW